MSDFGKAPLDPRAPWAGRSLLLAEDDAELRGCLAQALRLLGFEPVQAEDGARALQLFRAGIPDLAGALLDCDMPRLGGVEVLRELRRTAPSLPVLLMSGRPQRRAISRLHAGEEPSGFLPKPFNLERLREGLREAIEGPPTADLPHARHCRESARPASPPPQGPSEIRPRHRRSARPHPAP